jgi:hypothetical protein
MAWHDYVLALHPKISMQVQLLLQLAFSVGDDSLNFTNVTEPLRCGYIVAKGCIKLPGFIKQKHDFYMQ